MNPNENDAPFIIVEALYPGLTQLDFTGPHTIFSRIPSQAGAGVSPLLSDQSSPGGTEFGSVADGTVTVAVTASESRRIALLVQKGAFPKSRVC